MLCVEVLASGIVCVKSSSGARLFATETPACQDGVHRQYFRCYGQVNDNVEMRWLPSFTTPRNGVQTSFPQCVDACYSEKRATTPIVVHPVTEPWTRCYCFKLGKSDDEVCVSPDDR